MKYTFKDFDTKEDLVKFVTKNGCSNVNITFEKRNQTGIWTLFYYKREK